ncbi:MAG: tetraacyldisaccharide 4'-kinase [Bacteroidota bacterium]
MILVFRILAAPFAFIYACILFLRNTCYDKNLLRETSFELPIINIGNLAFGGTGKTPHIEYLIRLLKQQYKVAILSRGYKRKTSGYFFATNESTAFEIGDEPTQIKQKFKTEIDLAVSENRVIGVPNLLFDAPETDVILLDDAFQHRAIKAGLNILLTDYNNLFFNDYLTPAGTLREYRAGYKRADLIVVTKCPADLTVLEKEKIIAQIKPLAKQRVFFSYQKYDSLVHYFDGSIKTIDELKETDLLLFSGIAKAQSFEDYLEKNAHSVMDAWQFGDHHDFTTEEITQLLAEFDKRASTNKIIISTEKDAMRLQTDAFKTLLQQYPIYYLPLQVDFFESDKSAFNQYILNYVEQNKRSY